MAFFKKLAQLSIDFVEFVDPPLFAMTSSTSNEGWNEEPLLNARSMFSFERWFFDRDIPILTLLKCSAVVKVSLVCV